MTTLVHAAETLACEQAKAAGLLWEIPTRMYSGGASIPAEAVNVLRRALDEEGITVESASELLPMKASEDLRTVSNGGAVSDVFPGCRRRFHGWRIRTTTSLTN